MLHFAGDYKSGLRLSGSHLIISDFLRFRAGLDLELVCHLVVICNSFSVELNMEVWMNLPLPVEPVFFPPTLIQSESFLW